ncbi:MAG: Cna B-type domain-containing protein [Oscillospiraceae bacterium]|nr:Cna B-type domain-containing protein [Oscillospiraceae bacterium]
MKRLVLAALAAAFLLPLAAVSARAMEPPDLTVVLRYGGKALEGIGVSICRVAGAVEAEGEIVYEAARAFSGAGADFNDLTTEKAIALAAVLDAYASAGGITRDARLTDAGGRAAFHNLSAGLYLVAQTDGENGAYSLAPYLAAVPGPRAAYPKAEPLRRDAGTVSLSVFKIWEGTDSPPGRVAAQLYRNGSAYGDSVFLHASNYWSHTWEHLDPNDTWTVDELDLPAGYMKKITGSVSGGFIITNTKISTDTNKITDTKIISDITDTKIPDAPEKAASAISPRASGFYGPKTDDPGSLLLWTALFAAAAMGLLALIPAARPIPRRHTPSRPRRATRP